jgi:heptosyltransferase-2
LVEAGWDRTTPLVAVAPGAAFGGAKRWPAEHFASVIDALAADAPDGSGETRPGRGARSRAVLVGARADRMAADDVVTLVRTRPEPIDLVGATDLSLFAGVLSCCRALVTNDSGAMHLAAALGVDVVAIFGPTNEAETRPLGSGRLSVVHASTWCRPCMLRECPLTHACMRRVSSDRVTAEVRASL